MSSFVHVAEDLVNEAIELPTEENGTLLLDSLKSQYGSATGLKYRNTETGGWRGVRLSDGTLHPPHGLWGDSTYIVVSPDIKPKEPPMSPTNGMKRRISDDDSDFSENKRPAKNPRHMRVPSHFDSHSSESYGGGSHRSLHSSQQYSDDANSGDLIVLGLSYGATDEDLKTYFEKFGEVEFSQVKTDMSTGSSRGFGFIRMKDPEVQVQIVSMEHTICGRRCELKPPKKAQGQNRVFVGRLPAGITKTDLEDYFVKYGTLCDIYIPKPFRGFAFLTFLTADEADAAMRDDHTLKGCALNVTEAEPRDKNTSLPMHGGRSTAGSPPWAQPYAQQAQQGWFPMALAHPQHQHQHQHQHQPQPQHSGSSLSGDNQSWATQQTASSQQQQAVQQQQQQEQQQPHQSLEQRAASYQFSNPLAPALPTMPGGQRLLPPPF